MLYFLIGLPASGKSSWAEKRIEDFPETILISSDNLRKELLDDENDQNHNTLIFNEMYKRCKAAILKGKDVIYDATNLSRKRRINFLKQMPKTESIAVVFLCPPEICKIRNAQRSRKVPEEVIDTMVKSFQPVAEFEGFNKIEYVSSFSENYREYHNLWTEDNIKTPHDNPNHSLTCGLHCRAAYEYAIANEMSQVICTAALYHDWMKYRCKTFFNKKGEKSNKAHFYNHENYSAYMIMWYMLVAYPVNNLYITTVGNLIYEHMSFFAQRDENELIKRLDSTYGKDFREKLFQLHECDIAAH